MATPAPSSSSSPFSEITATPNPYQQLNENQLPVGTKGSFETRKLNNGFYVRVDIPGVPNNGVKVVKYNETRTVTFSGKAPPLWPGFDSLDYPRVYAGYVVLDRDISDLNFTTEVDNGVIRFFFPRCDGSLHFISPPRRSSGAAQHDDQHSGQNEEVRFPADDCITFIVHSPLEPYDYAKSQYTTQCSREASEEVGLRYKCITLSGGKPEHINPHLISGIKGIYEHKIVPVKDGEHLIYIRVDYPDTCRKANYIMENYDCGIAFGGKAFKEGHHLSRFDVEGLREYFGILQPRCNCCRYKVIKHDTTDGVMRFLVRKSETMDRTPVCHVTLPPAAPGGDLQPKTLIMVGNLPPSLE